MDRAEWDELFERLHLQLEIIQAWAPDTPSETATRCEESRHRTLAHLRACQEQWLVVVRSFAERESPSVTILHPWRQFDAGGYALLPWEEHMAKFVEDRRVWMAFRYLVDWNRGGKWNRKPDKIFGLTKRLVDHEAYHIGLLDFGFRS